MANPTTGVLDDFNRADENPITGGGRWITPTPSSGANIQVISNEAGTTDSSGGSEAYWLPQRFAADQEVFATCTTKPDTGNWFFLNCRIDSNDSASAFVSSHFWVCYSGTGAGGTDHIALRRFSSAFGQVDLATADISWSSGDKFWMTALGDVYTCYRDSGSGYTQELQATDTQYNQAGFISFQLKNHVVRIDGFGGGSVAPDFPRQIYRRL
jgi:hypothetical protein